MLYCNQDKETHRHKGANVNTLTETKASDYKVGDKVMEVYNLAPCEVIKIDGDVITVITREASSLRPGTRLERLANEIALIND